MSAHTSAAMSGALLLSSLSRSSRNVLRSRSALLVRKQTKAQIAHAPSQSSRSAAVSRARHFVPR